MKNNLEKILFIPDSHVPYEDKKAFDLMLRVGKEFKPHHVVIGGDFGDFYGVSSHSKDPKRMLKFDWEIDRINERLDQIDKLGAKNKVFVEGNHEDRLRRYLQDKAPELNSLISIEHLFKLDKRNFEFIPYKQSYKLGKLNITHDTGTAGLYAHYKALSTFQHNVVINHTHRIGYTVVGSATNERHVGAMFGWLGDIEEVDYMHKIKAMTDWSLGFGIGYLDKSTGNVYLTPIPIVNYTCLVEGKLFK